MISMDWIQEEVNIIMKSITQAPLNYYTSIKES